MDAVPNIVGWWQGDWAVSTFAADGTLSLEHRTGGVSTGSYQLIKELPAPLRPDFWPVPSTGYYVLMAFDVPPDRLPWRMCPHWTRRHRTASSCGPVDGVPWRELGSYPSSARKSF